MSDNDFLLLKQQHDKKNALRPGLAVTGYGNGMLYDNINPLSGKVWVRQPAGSVMGTPALVRGPLPGSGAPLRNEVAVVLNFDSDGELRVMQIDYATTTVNGLNPLSTRATKKREFQYQQNFATLLVTPTARLSTSVHVYGWQPIIGNVGYEMAGQDVDLSSFIPALGLQCYAMLFVKSDYSTIEVKASTPISSIGVNTLGLVDRQECINAASPGSQPIWAVRLHDAQTTIVDADIVDNGVDMRQFINSTEAGLPQGFDLIMTDDDGNVMSDDDGNVMIGDY